MGDLVLTSDVLSKLATNSVSLCQHFDGLETTGQAALWEVFEYSQLHGALQVFQNDWDTTREKIIAALESFAEAAIGVDEVFYQGDLDMALALEGEGGG
jgi:hypothetical protein